MALLSLSVFCGAHVIMARPGATFVEYIAIAVIFKEYNQLNQCNIG